MNAHGVKDTDPMNIATTNNQPATNLESAAIAKQITAADQATSRASAAARVLGRATAKRVLLIATTGRAPTRSYAQSSGCRILRIVGVGVGAEVVTKNVLHFRASDVGKGKVVADTKVMNTSTSRSSRLLDV